MSTPVIKMNKRDFNKETLLQKYYRIKYDSKRCDCYSRNGRRVLIIIFE